MSIPSATFRVGTSGFQYDHWRCSFYPPVLKKDEWFDYYAKIFDTEEINTWLAEGKDVYAYFNNDAPACAPINARELRERVKA